GTARAPELEGPFREERQDASEEGLEMLGLAEEIGLPHRDRLVQMAEELGRRSQGLAFQFLRGPTLGEQLLDDLLNGPHAEGVGIEPGHLGSQTTQQVLELGGRLAGGFHRPPFSRSHCFASPASSSSEKKVSGATTGSRPRLLSTWERMG